MIIQPPWEDTAALENTTTQYDNTAPLGGHCCPRKHNQHSMIIQPPWEDTAALDKTLYYNDSMIIQPPWEDTAALENTTTQYDNTAPLGGHCCPRKHNNTV